ncbi:hypothetical protein S245_010724, partial [Arachis hypogaea]
FNWCANAIRVASVDSEDAFDSASEVNVHGYVDYGLSTLSTILLMFLCHLGDDFSVRNLPVFVMVFDTNN